MEIESLVENLKKFFDTKEFKTPLNFSGDYQSFDKDEIALFQAAFSISPKSDIGRGEVAFSYYFRKKGLNVQENNDLNNPDFKLKNENENFKDLFIEVKKEKDDNGMIHYANVSQYLGCTALKELRGTKRDISCYQAADVLIERQQRNLVLYERFCSKFDSILNGERNPSKVSSIFFKDCFRIMYEIKPGEQQFVLFFSEENKNYRIVKIGFYEDLTLEQVSNCSARLDGDRLVINSNRFFQ